MNELKLFNNSEFGELSIMLIDGKEYFPATACAKILGHQNPQRAVREFCKGVTKTVTPSAGGNQEVNYIPEGDLYRLIIRSNIPGAERFERWVFDEVLPAIRKQGTYTPDITAVITQTVQATISEVLRQLVPSVLQSAQTPTPTPALPLVSARRRRKPVVSLIGKLDTELRQEVEDMICSQRYTYFDIAVFLQQNYGLKVSKSSIGRYATKLFDAEDDVY